MLKNRFYGCKIHYMIKASLQSVYFLYWRCCKSALDGEHRGSELHLRLQFRSWQLHPKATCHFRKDVVAPGRYIKVKNQSY